MASVMASTSRDSNLNRNASTSSTLDFLRFDNARDDLAVMAESSSSTLLSTEIKLLDAAGAVTPISDGEWDPPKMARRTVDDVWREIVAGKTIENQPKEEMMTLEDFLAKVGEAEEAAAITTANIVEVKEEGLGGGFYSYDSGSGVLGRGRGSRSLSLLESLDKMQQQRQKRMIKNRESAARSRERKQAYQVKLESMAVRLEEENEQLVKEKADRTKKRLKQLMDTLIPVVEKPKPRRLHKVRSMQW